MLWAASPVALRPASVNASRAFCPSTSHGLPAALAYLVYVGEILAPVLLIVGLFTRPAALIVAINMVVAIWLVHQKDLGALNGQGGWALELQGMYLFSAIAVALFGGGRFGLGGKYN